MSFNTIQSMLFLLAHPIAATLVGVGLYYLAKHVRLKRALPEGVPMPSEPNYVAMGGIALTLGILIMLMVYLVPSVAMGTVL